MIRLFFDIETLPCDERDKERFLELLRRKNGNADKDPEEIFLNMGFDGTFGRICCIGYIKEDGNTITREVIEGDEASMLQKFWDTAKDVNLFIGHNILQFDFPFLYKRSIIKGVKPSVAVNLARYRNFPVFDTQKEWSKWADNGPSLDTLAKVLGFPTSKDTMDGSMVWPYYKDGKMEDICKYCMKDVELNRKVYYKMIFEEMPFTEEEQTENPTTEEIPF